MAIKKWKQFESSAWFRRNKLRLKRWVGIEPRLSPDLGLDLVTIGDWSLVDGVLDLGDVVYSMGICDDIDFERKIIECYGCRLFAFDPTPYLVSWIASKTLPDTFSFYPWAASGHDGEYMLYPRLDRHGRASKTMYSFHTESQDRDDGVRVDAYRLDSMMAKLEHEKIDLLKMDVEGAEYDVLNGLIRSSVRPKIILVEFHHRFKGIGKAATEDVVASLKELDYLIASISITGRELCFVRRQALVKLGFSQ